MGYFEHSRVENRSLVDWTGNLRRLWHQLWSWLWLKVRECVVRGWDMGNCSQYWHRNGNAGDVDVVVITDVMW